MKNIHITWKMIIEVWWSWFWRTSVYSCATGYLAGVIISFTYEYFFSATINKSFAFYLGYIIGTIISIFNFKLVLNKKFDSFKIVFLNNA